MVRRWAQFWIIVRQSLLKAVVGSILYASIVTILVLGGQDGGLYGYFRSPSIGGLLGVALLMVPVAMPTALAITVLQAFLPNPNSFPAVISGAIALAVLTAILALAFPIYMTALDHSNNWQRGQLLPAMVGAAAIIMWLFGTLRARKIACE